MLNRALLGVIAGSRAVAAPPPSACDPHFDQTTLLLPFDGVDGAATTLDESLSNKNMIFVGDAKISNAAAKFGPTSLRLDGNGDYIWTTATIGVQLADEDFTIEAWVRWTGSQQGYIAVCRRGGIDGWGLRVNTDGSVSFFNVGIVSIGGGGIPTGAWAHVAVTRSSGVGRVFINGVLVGSGDLSAFIESPFDFKIGGDINNGFNNWWFDGFIDDFRLTLGHARYTAAFTPPGEPFPLEQCL